jgi:hypothetical protein
MSENGLLVITKDAHQSRTTSVPAFTIKVAAGSAVLLPVCPARISASHTVTWAISAFVNDWPKTQPTAAAISGDMAGNPLGLSLGMRSVTLLDSAILSTRDDARAMIGRNG